LGKNCTFDGNMHLDLHPGHTAAVAHEHYEDENSAKVSVPANILRSGVSRELATTIVADAKCSALFEAPGHFQKDWPTRLEELPCHEDFLRQQRTSPSFFLANVYVQVCQDVIAYTFVYFTFLLFFPSQWLWPQFYECL
jgi:hypothetical protein